MPSPSSLSEQQNHARFFPILKIALFAKVIVTCRRCVTTNVPFLISATGPLQIKGLSLYIDSRKDDFSRGF
jgi:hypothetical protein